MRKAERTDNFVMGRHLFSKDDSIYMAITRLDGMYTLLTISGESLLDHIYNSFGDLCYDLYKTRFTHWVLESGDTISKAIEFINKKYKNLDMVVAVKPGRFPLILINNYEYEWYTVTYRGIIDDSDIDYVDSYVEDSIKYAEEHGYTVYRFMFIHELFDYLSEYMEQSGLK